MPRHFLTIKNHFFHRTIFYLVWFQRDYGHSEYCGGSVDAMNLDVATSYINYHEVEYITSFFF